ncbi:MAG: flagellar hook capping FlgD N-terminal domain-containing protein [Candidatus Krumholzibacteria bacterium]|jgi:flagellar basal-body rod modification protein FlgD|nr:flagellar hook capping FlgD N-terminal domain-containing protein [Candidatus Krumholzibacteria bacterium]MDP6669861.1 flagellar hook capping FlgD N-terminal domain-containing protein [Candidatus Krumholzibacteria bacterium]MDP6796616.1 flagellar hook capping FlgD N-terminal domain-containing protein [Candidatus Krumholzibacteria bacterium]MDP7020950.1 flagellar hook capping FlgD N-terminal domain-containing protein [Candidatus Krumholzibacteria bacterium]
MNTPSVNHFNATPVTSNSRESQLGKDDFLKLLVTQLQHQDPLSPMGNEDFLAQLAQFSSVEQLENINEGTQTGLLMQQSLGNALSTQLIGKEVLLDGSQIDLITGASPTLSFQTNTSSRVTVRIVDGWGNTVRTLDPGDGEALEAGTHSLSWDGLDDEGQSLAEGSYQVVVEGLDASGNPVSIQARISGLVEAVRFANGSAFLLIDGQEHTLSEVIEVRAAGETE